VRRRPRRLWSLPASRAAHGIHDELQAISRVMREASWLLLALVLAYILFNHRELAALTISAVLGVATIYATALVALRFVPGTQRPSQWPMLIRCWLMIALITFVLWELRFADGPLIALYHVAVIASAVALSELLTVLNLGLIGLCLWALAQSLGRAAGAETTAATALFAQLSPMILIAYVVMRAAGDIRKALSRIRFISETDELTRLYNVRAFMRIAERLHRQAKRYGRPYAVVMIDSDNLKSVNDTHGHECGNDLLKLTTASIRRELRETDVAGRYGGDEFILLLPETAAAGARELSERVRRAVMAKTLDARGMRVTTSVSIGVASFPDHGADLQSIVNKADQAMYLSKKTGRNRVTLFDPG